ncbi:hypothetical protein [Azospirillum argentinense]|uniref:hypothetical protein n=1 Tax=Azospirillum argentinense TaxID=2970906 RepID=UPI001FFF1D0E|nr:hypothetical protein [Azospirillum argentinense]
MDETQRSFYGLMFENAYLREKGKAFETLFARVMGHGFVGDFEPVRPYGPKGDLKCDGFRPSDGTVFQSYAPDTMKLEALLAKMDEDFNGAVAHWGVRMRRWRSSITTSAGCRPRPFRSCRTSAPLIRPSRLPNAVTPSSGT